MTHTHGMVSDMCKQTITHIILEQHGTASCVEFLKQAKNKSCYCSIDLTHKTCIPFTCMDIKQILN